MDAAAVDLPVPLPAPPPAPLDLDDALRCLTEAEQGRRRPELCGGRYVVVAYDEDASAEDELGVGEDFPADDEAGGIAVVGEAASLYDAFDLISTVIVTMTECDDAAEALDLLTDGTGEPEGADEDEYEDEDGEDRALWAGLRSAERRLLAYTLLGHAGPMDTLTSHFPSDPYIGLAPCLFPGARFVFLSRAAPPHHEVAYGILELQPVGEPTDTERALLDASGRGDTAALAAALAAGAGVDALDERGMGALHLAVAHRRLETVRALLAAGADPGLQAAYGNAPHFAAYDRKRRVMPCADAIDDAGHDRILRALVEAGAPLNARDRTDATLLDLAVATRPYPAETVRFLAAAGAESGRLERATLSGLLDRLPYYYSRRELEIRVNEVRFLLDAGADPRGSGKEPGPGVWPRREDEPALHVLLGHIGYQERDVPGEILLALVEELLRRGIRDDPYGGRTALDHAERWLNRGHANYLPVVERLRAAARTSGGGRGA